MIESRNPGIEAAIRELRQMSIRGIWKARYEARQKAIRDRKAQDAYVRMQGIEEAE